MKNRIKKPSFVAVITGDVIGFSTYDTGMRKRMLSVLKTSFRSSGKLFPGPLLAPFEIFRGDSFQGVMSDPRAGLPAAVALRASVLASGLSDHRRDRPDLKIAVGIGPIDYLPAKRGGEGDGEAFRLSGRALDGMKKDRRMVLRTPWQPVNQEMDVHCALLDALMDRWSAEQASAVLYMLQDYNQRESAEMLRISQPAVRHRLKHAGAKAVDSLIRRWNLLLDINISSAAYKY